VTVHCRLQSDVHDPLAFRFLPEDCHIRRPFPIKATPDGNCFSNAVSRLLFGTQDFATEVRVRLIVEGVVHKALYLDNKYLESNLHNFTMPGGACTQLAVLSGAYGMGNTRDDVELIYNREMLEFCKDGAYASMWQCHQLAGMTGLTIMSIYPLYPAHEAGNASFLMTRKLYNRVIPSPHYYQQQRDDNPKLAIMWTPAAYHGNFNPNHFVSVVS